MTFKAELALIEVDLNDLFTLTYSFDSLKKTIEALHSNQKLLANKIGALEETRDYLISNRSKEENVPTSVNNDKNSNVNSQRDSNGIRTDQHRYSTLPLTQQKGLLPKLETISQHEEDIDIIRPQSVKGNGNRSLHHLSTNIFQSPNHFNQPQSQIAASSVNQLIKTPEKLPIASINSDNRIKVLEKKIKSLTHKLKAMESHPRSSPEQTSSLKYDIDALKQKDTELETKLVDVNAVLDALKVKVMDFNIFELFKSTSIEGGSIDVTQALYQSLEQKVFKKFALIDDRMKLNDYDMVKSKNDVSNMRIQLEGYIHSNNILIDDLAQRQDKSDKEQVDASFNINELADQCASLKEKIAKTKDSASKAKLELRQANDALSEQLGETNKRIGDMAFNKEMFVSEQTHSKFKEAVLKKVHDIDHKFYEVNPIERFNRADKRIQEIYDLVKDKPNKHDIALISDKVLTLTKKIDYAKESELNMQESIDKFRKDMIVLTRRIEAFQSMISSIKNDNPTTQAKREVHIDLSKYLELSTFNDFLKYFTKEKEKTHKEIEDLNAISNDVKGEVKTRASEYDLKRVEEYLLEAIEELKRSFSMKYVDKIEIAKTFKLVEHQIRQIIETMAQRDKKRDNWLLAKKPLGGHNCASCEAYIGDLNNSNEFLPWNKVQGKESFDFIGTRTGNGFSRILSMVNVGQKKDINFGVGDKVDKEHSFESEGDEKKRTLESRNKVNKRVQLDNQTVEEGYYYGETTKEPTHQRVFSDNEPRIIKIFKRQKKTNDKAATIDHL